MSVFDKTSETIRNDTFYTTDTEAYLVFELIDEDFTPDSATVTVYNVYGKATINANVEVADGIVQYKIPVDAIGHPGGWRTQVIFTKDNEDYTTKIIEFDVGGHLLDNKKPAIVDIENWNSFIAYAGELIDDWEQLEEIRQTNEQQRELAESARQNEFETNEVERESTFETNESARQANELIREETEGNRQSTFEENEVGRQSEFEENELARESAESERVANEEKRELNEAERISKDSERDSKIEAVEGLQADLISGAVDSAAVQQHVEERYGQLEEEYAPKLTEVTAQLAQKASKHLLDETNDKIDSLESGFGGTYNTVSDLQAKYPNGDDKRYVVLEDGNWYWWNGSTWVSGGNFQSVGITDEVEEAVINKMGVSLLTNKIGRMKDDDEDGIADGFTLGSDVDSYRFSNDRQYWTSEVTSGYSSSLYTKTEPSVKNHKYYLKFNGQSLNQVLWSGATTLSHWTGTTGTTSVIFDTEDQTAPYEFLRFYNRTPNVESFVEKIIFIDLTEAYGYGNEPSLEKMDSLIEEIGYFTGRTSDFDGNKINEMVTHLDEKQKVNEQAVMNEVAEIKLSFNSEFIDSDGDGRADNVTFGSTPLNSRVSNNTQYWTTNEKQNYNSSLNIKTPDATIGHKYYISFEHGNMDRAFWIGPPNLSFYTGTSGKVSYVFNTSGVAGPLNGLRFYTRSSSVESFVGNLIMIDLTEIYGIGSEPNAAEMDRIVNVIKNDLIKNKRAYVFNVNNINTRILELEKNINNPSPIKDNEISMKNLKVIEAFDDSDDWTVQGGALKTVSEIDKSAYPEDFVYGYTGYIPRWGKKMLQYDVSQNSHFHKPLDTFSLDIDVEKVLLSYFYDDTRLSREGISESIEIRLHSEYPNINEHYFTAPGIGSSLSTIPGKWEYRTSNYGRVGTPNPKKINGISVRVTTAKPIRLYFGGLYKYNRQNQKGAILLDFDDSLKSFYTEAFAYMSTKGMRGNVSVIGSAVDAGSHAGLPTMTIDEHLNMQAAGWSLTNHTYDNAGVFGTEEQIYGAIEKGDKWMRENGMKPVAIVPVGNGVNRLTSHVANKFYDISRGQGSPVSYFPQPDLMNIGSLELNESSSFDLWKSRLSQIEADKHVRSFHFHEIGYEGYGYMTPEKFRQFIDEIEKYDIQVLTYGDILNGKWV